MFGWLSIFCKNNKERIIHLREEFGTPEENTEELKKLIAVDFEKIRERKDDEHIFIGRFLSIVLLVEAKLVQVLCKYEPKIEDFTFGRKINLFKDFLRDLKKIDEDTDIEEYRNYIAPLKEIADIRNDMAHDLSYIYFKSDRLPQTLGFLRKERPDLFAIKDHAESENDKNLATIASFAFQFSSRIAFLVQIQK